MLTNSIHERLYSSTEQIVRYSFKGLAEVIFFTQTKTPRTVV